MLKVSTNNTFREQQKKLVSATFKKAIITAVYQTNLTVDVYIVGNNQTVLRNIPVASNVDITTVAQGDRCRIDMFSETNPNDMVMAYTYGKPQVKKPAISSGTTSVSFSGTVIPHGLGVIPDFISIIPNGVGDIYQNLPVDAVNIYLTYASMAGSLSTTWYAVKF